MLAIMDVNMKISLGYVSYSLSLLPNPEYYRRLVEKLPLVGKLIYWTVTYPNISFFVSIVSQYMHSPRVSHLQAIESILCYLKKSEKISWPGTRLSTFLFTLLDCLCRSLLCGFIRWLPFYECLLHLFWRQPCDLAKQEADCCCLFLCRSWVLFDSLCDFWTNMVSVLSSNLPSTN